MVFRAVLVCLIAIFVLSPVTAQQQSCAACNCPLDSDEDIDAYIAEKVNDVMGNEPRKL